MEGQVNKETIERTRETQSYVGINYSGSMGRSFGQTAVITI